MVRSLRAASLLALTLTACTIGPTPPDGPAPAAAAPAPAAAPSGAMPAGHPPTGAMPAGHPPTGEMPAGHPPSGAMPAGHPPMQPGAIAAGGPPAAAGALRSAAGGLAWKAPEVFAQRAPKSQMRVAEYGVAGAAGEGELTVYYFGPGQGGSVQANLDRWIGQFSQPDGSDNRAAASIAERRVGELKVTTLDLAGTYSGGMAPMMQQAPAAPTTDHRVLGAIVEGPQGPVFFKLTGPAATLEAARAGFDALVGSVGASR